MQPVHQSVPFSQHSALPRQSEVEALEFPMYPSPSNTSCSTFGSHKILYNVPSTTSNMADLPIDKEYKAYLFPLVIAMPFIVTYLITSLFSSIVFRSYRRDDKPPLAPYWVPVLGHAISFFYDTGFVGKIQGYGLRY